MKDKIVISVSVFIFVLIILLTAISSEWGMSLLSQTIGDTLHFSKQGNH